MTSGGPLDFNSLDLPPEVMQGIREAGFVTATPIQEAALPLALKGKDVAGQSQTGTGKTAAFLISAFTRLLRNPSPPSRESAPRVLVIAPTRELVVQIESDAHLLGRFTGLRTLAVYGGIDYNKQREALAAGCDILVGTPGRLIDYLKQHIWSPRRVDVLVIDEADRMFDMGFIADLRFILRRLPPPDKRQSFLFSATLSFRVLELTWEFMNNPAQITIMPQQKTAERVEQTLYHVGREEKFPLLLGLLRREASDRILIFSNTREEARRLEDRLTRNGWEARALTGDVDQKRRLRILNDFKEGLLPVLVATDVASRGLHIEAVTHVINWDLPQDAEDYVHRIGRTARAGAGGKAVGLVDESSALVLEAIEKFIGQKIPVEWADDDLFVTEIRPSAEERRRYNEERRARMDARRSSGDRGGRRSGPGGGGGRDRARPGADRPRPAPEHPRRDAAAPERPRADSPAPPSAAGGERAATAGPRRRGRRGGSGRRPDAPSSGSSAP
jgi:ATP-dependent RNA helicase RhlB